eukprot:scaffold863_cov101-Isochrysis_galbana.AAC.2
MPRGALPRAARAGFVGSPRAAEERAIFGQVRVAKSGADLADGLPPAIGREGSEQECAIPTRASALASVGSDGDQVE